MTSFAIQELVLWEQKGKISKCISKYMEGIIMMHDSGDTNSLFKKRKLFSGRESEFCKRKILRIFIIFLKSFLTNLGKPS